MEVKTRSFAETLLNRTKPAEEQVEQSAYTPARPHTAESIMLELHLRDGNVKSLGYSYLVEADFDASGVIDLQFSTRAVRIEGRNLRALYDRIVQHKVGAINEMDVVAAEMAKDKSAELVTRISFPEEEEE